MGFGAGICAGSWFTITQAYSLQYNAQNTQGVALGFYMPALQAENRCEGGFGLEFLVVVVEVGLRAAKIAAFQRAALRICPTG